MGIAYGRDYLGNIGFWGAYPIVEYPDTIKLVQTEKDASGKLNIKLKMHVPKIIYNTRGWKIGAYCLTDSDPWYCAGRDVNEKFDGYARWYARKLQLRIKDYNLVVTGGLSGSFDTGNVSCGDKDLGFRTLNISIPSKVLRDFPPKDGKYQLSIEIYCVAVSYVRPWGSPVCETTGDSDDCSIIFTVTARVLNAPSFYVDNVKTDKVEYYADEDVVVSGFVHNTGDIDGYADIVVKVDDIEIKTDRVYVTAKSHQEVSYKLSNFTVGKHEVCIDVK